MTRDRPSPPSARRRAAVVGSGVAGLTAAHLLQRRYEVTLFEADDRLGGHAHTHDAPAGDGRLVPVDSGFIVHNERTYPSLLRLFDELGVATRDAEMSMSIRCEGCGLQYAGALGANGVLAQRRRAVDPRFLRLLVDVRRFHRRARALLDDDPEAPSPADLGSFLAAGRFSAYFVRHFMVPLVSCVWSAGSERSLQYPARYLFQFLDHHGMLSVSGSPSWKTVVGGSRSYVERAAKGLAAVETMSAVTALRRTADGVEIRDGADAVHHFDVAVVATHPDQALRLLVDATDTERAVLGTFQHSRNEAVLHTDAAVLPTVDRARASWNHLKRACDESTDRVMVSYWMNRLQRMEEPIDYVVSLNAEDRVDPRSVLATMTYQHPLYTVASVAAQRRLPELNRDRLAFAGAYQGWGFHEDGCASGVRAAAALGADWDLVAPS